MISNSALLVVIAHDVHGQPQFHVVCVYNKQGLQLCLLPNTMPAAPHSRFLAATGRQGLVICASSNNPLPLGTPFRAARVSVVLGGQGRLTGVTPAVCAA